jgi:hypothetical protein
MLGPITKIVVSLFGLCHCDFEAIPSVQLKKHNVLESYRQKKKKSKSLDNNTVFLFISGILS